MPDRAIDLRVQDLLLIPALLYALIARGEGWGHRRLWQLVMLLGWVATVVTLLHAAMEMEPAVLVRAAFLARGLEPFVLAAVVCRLVIAAGAGASRWALRALWTGVAANLAWVAYQSITGDVGTLLGSSVGDLIESYGPKLIGEPSAFGTGAFWAASAALMMALYSTRPVSGVLTSVVLAAVTIAAYEAQSRIWLGAIVVFSVLMVFRPGGRSRTLRVVLSAAAVTVLLVWPTLPSNQRLSTAGVDNSVTGRVDGIWQPLLDSWLEKPASFLIGLGPGGLGTTGLTEAHNVALRALLDYGPVGAVLLLAIGWTVFASARTTARDLAEPVELRLWAEFARLSMVGLAVAGLVQDAFTAVTSSHLAALAVGLYAGMHAIYHDNNGEPSSEHRLYSPAFPHA